MHMCRAAVLYYFWRCLPSLSRSSPKFMRVLIMKLRNRRISNEYHRTNNEVKTHPKVKKVILIFYKYWTYDWILDYYLYLQLADYQYFPFYKNTFKMRNNYLDKRRDLNYFFSLETLLYILIDKTNPLCTILYSETTELYLVFAFMALSHVCQKWTPMVQQILYVYHLHLYLMNYQLIAILSLLIVGSIM